MCPWLFESFPVSVGPRENAGPSSTFVEIDVNHKTVFFQTYQKGSIQESTHTHNSSLLLISTPGKPSSALMIMRAAKICWTISDDSIDTAAY